MNIKEQINQNLKSAMLDGDKTLVTTLRGLKSAILYAEVATGNREVGLSDNEIVELFMKEAKKRQESADLYQQGGNEDRARAELTEKQVIEHYLPAQLSNDELAAIIAEVSTALGETGPQAMGKVIAAVKARTAGRADGARIAQLVKQHVK